MAGTYARSTDVLVLGGGPAGYMAAIRLGQLGRKVVLVEKRELGGECLNRGCIPSKALIHASRLYAQLREEGDQIGVTATGVAFDMGKTQRWKTEVVAKERQGVQTLLKGAGVTVLPGEARFTGPRSAQYTAPDGGSERIDFQDAVVATGAVPVTLPGFETDAKRVVNAWDLLSLDHLPSSMIVLGGGVSGCELGEFAARVGVQVTIVELMPQLLPGVDTDLAREITRGLERIGVSVRIATRAVSLDRSSPQTLSLRVEDPKGPQTLTAEMLFVTIGKRPDSRELGLTEAGVQSDPKSGFIGVDAQQRTNVPNIYAAGDVARPPMLAHKAYREGIVAAEAISGRPTRFDFQAIPSVVFTTPELATVGFTLADALRQGYPQAREARFPYAALGRAHASHALDGWVKIVGDDASGLLLGAHAAGEGAGDYIAEIAHALEMGSSVRDLAQTIHPHPTFSEALSEAALLWLNEPMHVTRRGPSHARP
jgi:dihydrolipoamide dehydrogenase